MPAQHAYPAALILSRQHAADNTWQTSHTRLAARGQMTNNRAGSAPPVIPAPSSVPVPGASPPRAPPAQPGAGSISS